ncbi:MAG: FxsA family protein [Pseudomonadota bacterium]|nr:FxsA family protein [Pseudomonadota bacterium]
MGAILFFIFIIVPIVEIILFIIVGDRIGLLATIGVVILTAIIGTFLIRHQGIATIKKAQENLKENIFPVNEVFDGLCILIAGALLLTPGFFTDAIGFSLFIPSLRISFKQMLSQVITNFRQSGKIYDRNEDKFKKANENIIDVEFENITKNNNRKS